jgi:hypothetical protein
MGRIYHTRISVDKRPYKSRKSSSEDFSNGVLFGVPDAEQDPET